MADCSAGERLEQPELDARRHYRHRVEHLARLPVETGRPGEHGVAHRRRKLGAGARERLRDEERVSPGAAKELLGVDCVGLCELLDRLERERHEPNPRDSGLARQPAEDDAKRMIRLQLVVAIGDEDEASRPDQAAAEESKEVEARLVGPVVVLEHEHRPGSPKLVE